MYVRKTHTDKVTVHQKATHTRNVYVVLQIVSNEDFQFVVVSAELLNVVLYAVIGEAINFYCSVAWRNLSSRRSTNRSSKVASWHVPPPTDCWTGILNPLYISRNAFFTFSENIHNLYVVSTDRYTTNMKHRVKNVCHKTILMCPWCVVLICMMCLYSMLVQIRILKEYFIN